MSTAKIEFQISDCLEVLPTLAENSIDSCVTDPPYHLTSIVKRFGKNGSAPAQFGTDGAYARASSGFMGKQWDGGDIAFRPETWAEVYRVLKPGAHLLAFGGTRTYHRMACAIEDAGFEIRDCIQWIYGSGFPKSHDVSKGIDRRGGVSINWFGPWLRKWREEKQVTQKQISELFPSKTGGLTGCVANWELGLNLPTNEQFNLICNTFEFPFASMQEAEREIIGKKDWQNSANHFVPGMDHKQRVQLDETAPATDAARQWEGWGTALKPACEPIVLARKPLSEKTVAANVLRWGTGAININACRVSAGERRGDGNNGGNGHEHRGDRRTNTQNSEHLRTSVVQPDEHDHHSSNANERALDGQQSLGLQDGYHPYARSDDGLPHSDAKHGQASVRQQGDEHAPLGPDAIEQRNHDHLSTFGNDTAPDIERLGRWPANVIHDGSEEVLAGFPETGTSNGRDSIGRVHQAFTDDARKSIRDDIHDGFGDTGSAARFFYTSKADVDDRIGSKHPTVKPLDLMQYLVRLITPKGGTVLDPFAGTGTTGEAAFREGMRALLIEREAEYAKDIERRIAMCMAGPVERANASMKAKVDGKPRDDGPLFNPEPWDDMWSRPFDRPDLV